MNLAIIYIRLLFVDVVDGIRDIETKLILIHRQKNSLKRF